MSQPIQPPLTEQQLNWLCRDLAEAGSEWLDVGECIGATARTDMAIALIGVKHPLAAWTEARQAALSACGDASVCGFVVLRRRDAYEVRGPLVWDESRGPVDSAEGLWTGSPLWRGLPDEVYVATPGPRLRVAAIAEVLSSVTAASVAA